MAESVRTYNQRLEEFKGYYQKYPRNLIKDKLNITDHTFDKMLRHCIQLEISQRKEEINLLAELERTQPFSKNEDDYGNNAFEGKQMITREGMLIFKGTNPLIDCWNDLSSIAQHYKGIMKENNIILPKISHENFYKYEQSI